MRRVHWIVFKRNRTVVVDIGSHTFVFRGLPTDSELLCVGEGSYSKTQGVVDRTSANMCGDRLAAGGLALRALKLWARWYPTTSFEDIADTIVWPEAFSADPVLSREIANQDVAETFLASLPVQLTLFARKNETLP